MIFLNEKRVISIWKGCGIPGNLTTSFVRERTCQEQVGLQFCTGMEQWNNVISPPKRNESFVRKVKLFHPSRCSWRGVGCGLRTQFVFVLTWVRFCFCVHQVDHSVSLLKLQPPHGRNKFMNVYGDLLMVTQILKDRRFIDVCLITTGLKKARAEG